MTLWKKNQCQLYEVEISLMEMNTEKVPKKGGIKLML